MHYPTRVLYQWLSVRLQLPIIKCILHLPSTNALHTDTSCFSPERCIFITGDDIYTSPHWYEVLPESELAAYRAAFPQSPSSMPSTSSAFSPSPLRSTLLSNVLQNGKGSAAQQSSGSTDARLRQSPSFDTTYNGLPYSALVSALEGCHAPQQPWQEQQPYAHAV